MTPCLKIWGSLANLEGQNFFCVIRTFLIPIRPCGTIFSSVDSLTCRLSVSKVKFPQMTLLSAHASTLKVFEECPLS